VAAIMEAYIADLDERGKDAPRARYAWKALAPHFGALRPDQIDRAACRVYVRARMAAGRKTGTASKELDTLASGLRWHDKATPAVIELPPKAAPRDRWITREEFDRLAEGAATEHVRLFIELARATAGRAEAILQLTWDRVDFQRGVIRLSRGDDPRQKRRATVPLTNRVLPLLERAKAAALTDHVIEYAGRPVLSIKKGFARAAERAGLIGVTPHVIRHSIAVWLAEDGHAMSEIAQYLGHSNSKVTESTYSRYSPHYLRKLSASLE
jgi:integrase